MRTSLLPDLFFIVIVFCMCFLYFPVYGQEHAGGARIVSNFKGFEAGYAYPYVTRPRKNHIVNRDFDFGLQANYQLGKNYPSGNALGLRPGVAFASIGENTHMQEHKANDGTIISSRTFKTAYRSLSLQLTGIFEFKLLNVKFGLGAFYSTPVFFSGSVVSIKKGYPGSNNTTYEFSSAFRPNIGANAKMFIPIARTSEKEVFLSFEYLINANATRETDTQEHWLMLSFIRRSLIIKEVRQKWDRYFPRKR